MRTKTNSKNLILAIVAIVQTILIVSLVTFAWIEGVDESRLHGNNIGISSSPKLLMSLSDKVGTIEINDYLEEDFALKEVSSIDGKNLYVADGYENYLGRTFRTLRAVNSDYDKNVAYLQFDVSMVFDATDGDFANKVMNVFFNPYKSYVIKSQSEAVNHNLIGIEAGSMQAFAESQGYATWQEYYIDFLQATATFKGVDQSLITTSHLDDYYDYLYDNQENENIPDCPPYKPYYAESYEETGYLVSRDAPEAVLNPIRVSLTYDTTTVIMGMREEDNASKTWQQLMSDATATKAVSEIVKNWTELEEDALTNDQILQQAVKARIAGQRVYSLCGTSSSSWGCNSQNALFNLAPDQQKIVTIRIWLEGGDVETTDDIANTQFDIQLYFDTDIVNATA
ncbi:MAG: hypothetical protein J6R37_03615 [Clostridia bacterium]|nr:hypothetical protein [Clostridia bacterium]